MECYFCGNDCEFSVTALCPSCLSNEMDQVVVDEYEDGEDGYAAGGWDDGREAFNDPGHFEG